MQEQDLYQDQHRPLERQHRLYRLDNAKCPPQEASRDQGHHPRADPALAALLEAQVRDQDLTRAQVLAQVIRTRDQIGLGEDLMQESDSQYLHNTRHLQMRLARLDLVYQRQSEEAIR